MLRLRVYLVLVLAILLPSYQSVTYLVSQSVIPAYWLYETREFERVNGNYIFRLSPDLVETGIATEVEAGMDYFPLMGDYLEHDLAPPILIAMNSADLNLRVGGESSVASAGIYHGGVIILGYQDSLQGIKQTLIHELAHYYIDSVARGNYPTWYGEGLAQVLERKYMGKIWFDGIGHNDYYRYSISELSKDFHGLPDQISAYKMALELTVAIEELGGGQAHIEILKALNQGSSFSWALETYTGSNLESLYNYAFGLKN